MKKILPLLLVLVTAVMVNCKKKNCENGIQDGDETGIDCGGSCSACVPIPEPTVNYPEKGIYAATTDDNILLPGVTDYTLGLYYRFSFGAILENNASLTIRWTTLTGSPGPALIPLSGLSGWQEYNESGDLIQTFHTSEQDTIDGEFWVESEGSALIEYYENGADTSKSAPYYKIVHYHY